MSDKLHSYSPTQDCFYVLIRHCSPAVPPGGLFRSLFCGAQVSSSDVFVMLNFLFLSLHNVVLTHRQGNSNPANTLVMRYIHLFESYGERVYIVIYPIIILYCS